MYTNLVGNPVDGFRCIGIYENLQDAIGWQESCDEDCWVTEIEAVDIKDLIATFDKREAAQESKI